MGYRDYQKIRKNTLWGDNNPLMMLLIINILVFILMHVIKIFYGLYRIPEDLFMQHVFAWISVPADPMRFIQRPWTLITAMFTQLNIMLLISNLLWLWTFGYILQDLAGARKLFPLYLYGGLAAALVFLLTYNLAPGLTAVRDTTSFFGATAPVMAIAVAATLLSPQYRLFPMINGGIPLWILTLVFFVIDFASISRTPGLFFPHLAAAGTGFFFGRALLRGQDWGYWMNRLYDRFTNQFNPKRKPGWRSPVREEVFYNTQGHQPFKKTATVTQQKVDEILDKINQKGYSRLTDEEKDLLKRASEEGL